MVDGAELRLYKERMLFLSMRDVCWGINCCGC